MAGAADSDCPACGAGAGGDPWCGVCGLDLRSEDARRLRHLASVLIATEIELERIRARRDGVAAELTERKIAANRLFETRPPTEPASMFVPPPLAPPTLMPGSPRGELPVDGVRNVLLWTGATLLALSALAFAAVAWTHLGPGGRAALLIAFTGVSAVLASGLRERLPASSGAFTGLTIALALVDWQVARRAGASSSLSATAWWAIGSAVVGGIAAGMGRIAAPAPARRALAVLVLLSAVLTVTVVAGAAWSTALGFALIAAAMTATDRFAGSRLTDRVVRVTLRVAAWTIWAAGAVLAIVAAFGPTSVVQALAPAAVMLAMAIAPAIESLGRRPITGGSALGAFLVVVSGIGAVLTLASTSVGPVGLLTLAAVLGTLLIAAAPSLAQVWRNAANLAGVVSAGAGVVFANTSAGVCELGPLAWFSHAWEGSTRSRALRVIVGPHTTTAHAVGWCAVAILAVVAGAIAIASLPRREKAAEPRWRVGAIGLGLLAIVVAPIAAGATVLVSLAVATSATTLALFGSAVVTRWRPQVALRSGWLAVIPAVPLAGWAASTRATSISVLAIFVVAVLVAAAVGREVTLRAVHAGTGALGAITLASVVTLASGGSRPAAGFVGGLVAGLVLFVGVFVRRDTLDGLVVEITGGAGMIATVLLAVPSRAWIAATLTAMVPLLLGASARRSRNLVYGGSASAAALGATWMWLAAAGVTVVEAYTLPAALLAFAAGTFVWERVRAWSWLSLGPAIVLALAPTVGLAIVRHDDGRAVASGVAALAILLVGARRQLQAPLLLGASALVALGVDKIGPQAARLPRWTMLAIAGGLLLWVGTTFERRRDEMHRAARRLAGLR